MASGLQSDDNPFAAPQSDITPERYEATDGTTTFATFWQRFAASFVDGIIVQILAVVVGVAIGLAAVVLGAADGTGNTETMFEALGNLAGLAMFLLYYALQESSAAQATVGKRLIGLRVTDVEGRRLSFGRALARTLSKMLSYLTILIGFLIQPFTKRKQALHDLIAGTLVVKV